MWIYYNDEVLGNFNISWRGFRHWARTKKFQYTSLDEGEWLEVWGKEDKSAVKAQLG